MARKQTDVFGFDELEKAFGRMEKKYAVQSDAMLAAQAEQVKKRAKQKSPIGKGTRNPGRFRSKWGTQKVKAYKGGKVKVARVQNTAEHGHLVELGHKSYTTGGRKTGRVTRYNAVGRRVKGVSQHGDVKGKFILQESLKELEQRFPKGAEDLLDKIAEEVKM